MKHIFTSLVSFALGTSICFADPSGEFVRALHDRILTIDTHVDINPKDFTPERNIGMKLADVAVDLPKMYEGGLDAAFFIVYVGQGERTPEARQAAHVKALEKFSAIHRMTERLNPDTIVLATSPSEVRRIAASGKKVAMIGVENAYPLGSAPGLLEDYFSLGARYLSLTHNKHNMFADANYPKVGDPESIHNGVSDAGRSLIAEANRLGIILDISHASRKSALDIIRHSNAPVIASHSAVDRLRQHSRNVDDEILEAIRANNGVVHVVAFRSYLKETPPEKLERLDSLAAEYGLPRGDIWNEGDLIFNALFALPPEQIGSYIGRYREISRTSKHADISDLIDHVDYIVKEIGIDHVGLSSDFGGGGGVDGWNDASETLNVTIELLKRGYSESDIAKIWGENLLRVWSDVEKIALAQSQ